MRTLPRVIAVTAVVILCGCSNGESETNIAAIEEAGSVNPNSPTGAAEAYMRAVAAYDVREAFSHVNGGEELLNQPQDKIDEAKDEVQSALEADGGLEEFRVVDEQINGNRALIKMETRMGNGKQETATMEFVQVDGRWLLDD